MKPVLAVVIPLLLVTACSPSQPDPVPVPSSPDTSVSTASPSPTVNQEELYAEAERVFRRSIEVSVSYEANGDFSGFPAEMYDLTMGEYLEASKALYDFMAEKGWQGTEGSPIVSSEPAPQFAVSGAIATLHVCTDSRALGLVDQNGTRVVDGKLIESRFHFKRDTDELLKIFLEEYREVETCELDS